MIRLIANKYVSCIVYMYNSHVDKRINPPLELSLSLPLVWFKITSVSTNASVAILCTVLAVTSVVDFLLRLGLENAFSASMNVQQMGCLFRLFLFSFFFSKTCMCDDVTQSTE